MSLESVQSIDVAASQSGADYGRGAAGTMAIHARTGGDHMNYSATNIFPGVNTSRGVRVGSWTPRGNISGPWRKGKAWFFNTTELQYANTLVPELPRGQDRSASWRVYTFLSRSSPFQSLNVPAKWPPGSSFAALVRKRSPPHDDHCDVIHQIVSAECGDGPDELLLQLPSSECPVIFEELQGLPFRPRLLHRGRGKQRLRSKGWLNGH